MPSEDYTSTPSTGKLKLKGVKDSKIAKKGKKNKSSEKSDVKPTAADDKGDNSVMLSKLENEDREIEKDDGGRRTKHDESIRRDEEMKDGGVEGEGEGEDLGARHKTEAEKRYDEQRRKRLDDRLKREGVKTHKQRVEELNRYLSGLSEHHDMPRIGPG